ncbi:YkvA family protein [Psychrobacillus sp. FSL H8-0483]|uniref:YkvA family protein n=1 Tax=Psychrobacillus sp. FSL H8-0483 TaxID=2921389 RepID=UPI00315A485C
MFRKKKQNDELEVTQEEIIDGVNFEEVEKEEKLDFEEKEVEELKFDAENMEEEAIQNHGKYYSEDKLWKKIRNFAKRAGSSVIYAVLLLYFTLQKPEVPLKVKATIVGALGYFILPIDIIPDVAMGVGYIDDLSLVMVALFQVAIYIDADIKKQAKDKLKDWFGDDVDTSDIDDKL